MPLIPRADSEDTREPEEEEETPRRPGLRTGLGALEDETNAPEGAGIYESGSPTSQNEELVFDPVPANGLFSFLEENEPAFIEFNGD